MAQSFVLYCHTNLINNKKYFGITGRLPEKRWGNNGCNYKRNEHFYSAIQKYGWDNFSHEVLFTNLSQADASKLEQEYISKYNTINPKYGYNNTSGGEINYYFSDETKQKMSEAASKRVFTDEWRKHLSESRKGRESWNKGVSPSAEIRAKLSRASTGRYHTEKSKKLMQEKSWNKKAVTIDGQVFISIQECAKYLGVTRSMLRAWLNGENSFSQKYVDRGLSFCNVEHEYVLQDSSKVNRSVICEGKVFDCMRDCDRYYNLPKGTVSNWVNKRCKMPQDFINKGLSLYQEKMYFYKIVQGA